MSASATVPEASGAVPEAKPQVPRWAWQRLAACTAAAALLQLDGTLITVALPSVAHGLSVKGSSTSAVLSAYFAAYALLLIPGGELVDRFGARRLALTGLALFAIGAAGGALAHTFGELIVARVVQGAGAGLVSPAALAGAVSGFPAERRGAALGIWGASAGMSNLVGPLLGGLLTVAFGWRADWWALVPLTVVAAIAIARLVPGVVHADEGPSGATVNRIVVVATLIAALTFGVMIGAFYIAEQYLQRVAGFSALGAAAALVLVALLVGAAAPIAGKLVDARGEVIVAVLGFLGTGVGLIVLGIGGVPLHDVITVLPLIPVGLGLGMLFVPVSRAALNATPRASHGRTSALLSVGRLLGAAVGSGLAGVALSGTLTAATVHHVLLIGAGVCLLIGVPASLCLGSSRAAASVRGTDAGR
ncbi:MAG TPA: MFS transporter [Solirubrobacteraceae bacterium]|nr:MFS transporter [Solirubrobacteraceae bacterium]